MLEDWKWIFQGKKSLLVSPRYSCVDFSLGFNSNVCSSDVASDPCCDSIKRIGQLGKIKMLKEKHCCQQYIKTMLKPVSNRSSVLACNAWLSCGQSSSPARTVFIRDVTHNVNKYEKTTNNFYRSYRLKLLWSGKEMWKFSDWRIYLHGSSNVCVHYKADRLHPGRD